MALQKQKGNSETYGKTDVASWRLRMPGWDLFSWMASLANRAGGGSGLVPTAKLLESAKCLMRFKGREAEVGDISGPFQEERPVEEEAQGSHPTSFHPIDLSLSRDQ